MNIVHVGGRFRAETTNGVNRAVSLYARYQRQLGHEVTMLNIGEGNSELRNEHGILEVEVHAPLAAIRPAPVLQRHLRKADVVHFHSAFVPWHNRLAPRIDAPYVVSPHGAYMGAALRRGGTRKALFRRLLDGRYLRGAGALHALTEQERLAIADYSGVAQATVLPNPVEAQLLPAQDERSRARSCFGVADDQFLLVFIGRLDVRQKGLDLFLEALRWVHTKEGGQIKALFAGPPPAASRFRSGQTLDSLRSAASLEGVPILPRVRSAEKRQLLAAADMFVAVSRWEGLPTAGLEALSLGVPILATPGSGLAEFVDEIDGGQLVEPDPESIAAGIAKAASQPLTCARREQIATATTAAFCPLRVAGELVDMYRSAAR